MDKKFLFSEEDIPGMSHNEFQLAMSGLIEKGLMKMIVVNGIKMYHATSILLKMRNHFDSNSKIQN